MSSELPAPERPSVNRALSWAFDAFKRNPLPFLSLAALVAVIQMVQQIAITPLQNALTVCLDAQSPGQVAACETAMGAGMTTGLLLTIVFIVLAFLATIGVFRAALAASRGQAPAFSMILSTANLGRYVVFSLMYAGIVFVGILLCIAPGLIAAFLLQLGPVFVLDRGERPVEAAKSSIRVVRRNVGPALVMVLLVLLVGMIGGAFYGILTLITLPFSTLFVVHMYRQFNGEPVA